MTSEVVKITEPVVVATPSAAPPLPMDQFADLLAADTECANMIDWWTKRRAKVRAKIAEIMGARTTGSVNNETVIHYDYVNQFNGSAFQKAYPDMYRMYSSPVTEVKLDVEKLRQSQPGLYRQFQTRKMLIDYKPPGAPEAPALPEQEF